MDFEKNKITTKITKSPEIADRTSISFFKTIKDEMIKKVGIPDEVISRSFLYGLRDDLVNLQDINVALQKRSTKLPLNSIKDIFRKKIPNHFLSPNKEEESLPLGGVGLDYVKKIKTVDLIKWRQTVFEYLKKIEKLKIPLSILREIEFDPLVKEFLVKYNRSTIWELLEPGFAIKEEDLKKLAFNIIRSFEYRNRKIKEFVAYRYAKSAPMEINIGDFALNVHSILAEENSFFRKSFLENNSNFNAPVAPSFIPYSMDRLNEIIKNSEPLNDKKQIKKEALRYYIFFEIIHPFEDANGRVGRSLFVYLQRRLSAKNVKLENPIHIPISRYESGTVYPQEILDSKIKSNTLGSISLDVNILLKRIIQREDILSLGKELPGFMDFDYENFDKNELKEKFDNFIYKILEILNSKETEDEIEKMIEVIEKQNLLDDMTSLDWSMVYDSMKESLKK